MLDAGLLLSPLLRTNFINYSLIIMRISILSFAALLMLGTLSASAQKVVSVGKGSYASYTPLAKSKSTTHGGDQSRTMQFRKLYIHERPGQPIPTNDWWTNLITDQYSGHLWSYPEMIQATNKGVEISWPSYWIDNGTEMKSNTSLTVGGRDFAPDSAVAETWHDWDVEFSMPQGSKQLLVTMAHGMPFTWVEFTGIVPQLTIGATANVTDANGNVIANGTEVSQFVVTIGDDHYGVYCEAGSKLTIYKGIVTLTPPSTAKTYLSVAMLHSNAELETLAPYALSVPRDTKVTWAYDARGGKVKTTWTVTATNLATGAPATDVLQGFMPHHYRNGATPAFSFNDLTYATPHGKMKMATGNNFEVDYNFYGMLPYYAAPSDTEAAAKATTPSGASSSALAITVPSSAGSHPFLPDRMTELINNYVTKEGFGGDTYWGGKSLTQLALNMMFAREMGNTDLFNQCRSKLKTAMVNWLTYTPGESNFFFARYDRWGGLVGYDTSYDSDTFNDHHFHYGYFTYAGALLALVDDDFRENYGQMLRLVAKDYANWDRTDTQYPLFRTFDPWAGHSFAGGMGDGNGNGQESTSEAMQSWGGLYLLGVALGDQEMRDAGLFGWVSEARGTAEYWFDRHGEAIDEATFHQQTTDDYNIPYTKFVDDQGKPHPYNSNLTCHGVGYWTYFGYTPLYMNGIQWMPISPALDYLSEDKAFANWDYHQVVDHLDIGTKMGGWDPATKTENGWLGDAGGWGNVVLAYLQRSNPEEAAKIYDTLWDLEAPEARTINTAGISYFVTHSHLTYGDLDWTTTADQPTARCYKKADDSYTYMAYNPTASEQTVNFYRNGSIVKTMTAAPRKLTVDGVTSTSVDDITAVDNSEPDPRESLVMKNLALGKTCTVSSEENAGTVKAGATDGDMTTRWGSNHNDNEYIIVDLGEEANLYKLKLYWETAYATEYEVALSNDGTDFTTVKTVSSDGGEDIVPLDDQSGRYIKITGTKRATDYGISLYEIEAYGQTASMTADDLLGVKITADADVLKQGQPSQLTVKGYTVGKQWKDVTPTWTTTDGTITADGQFTPSVAGSAKATATVDGLTATQTFAVEEALTVAKIALTPHAANVEVGKAQPFTLTATDQFGTAITANNVTYQVKTKDGTALSTAATFDAATQTLTGVTTADSLMLIATTGAIADTAYVSVVTHADINLALHRPAIATSEKQLATLAVDGDATTRWESDNLDDVTFQVDLGSTQEVTQVRILWEGAWTKAFTLVAGNTIGDDGYLTDGQTVCTVEQTLSGPFPVERTYWFDEAVNARYIQLRATQRGSAYGNSFYEFKVYDRPTDGPVLELSMNEDKDMVVVTGTATKANIATLNGINSAAIDVTNVKFRDEVTPADIQLTNPNAIIAVNGTVNGTVATATNLPAALVGNPNLVVINEQGYIFPLGQLQFNDDPWAPLYSKFFISTHDQGYRYSRTFAANAYATICLPATVTVADIPAGLSVYTFTGFDETTGIQMTKTTTDLVAGQPYLVHNTTSAPITLTCQGTGDLNLTTNPTTGVAQGSATMLATVKPIAHAEAAGKYIFQHNALCRVTDAGTAFIPGQCAYFEVTTASAKANYPVQLDNVTITGITEVNATNADETCYDLQGRHVAHPAKGVYIVNGKKMIRR